MLRTKQRIRGFYATIKSQQFYRILGVAVRRGYIFSSVNSELGALLESRIDSMIYRANFIRSMRFGRQLINHGYVVVNGVVITRPSHNVSMGQIVNIFIEPTDKVLRFQIRRGILTKRGKWLKFRRYIRRHLKRFRRKGKTFRRKFKQIKMLKKQIRYVIKKCRKRIVRGGLCHHSVWVKYLKYLKYLEEKKKNGATTIKKKKKISQTAVD